MTKQSNIFLTLVRKGGVTFFLLQVINSALEKKEMQWQILAFILLYKLKSKIKLCLAFFILMPPWT